MPEPRRPEVEYLEVRNQLTKSGSCSFSGTQSLTRRLVLAPFEALEYAVSDCRTHADWLDANGHRLMFTAMDL